VPTAPESSQNSSQNGLMSWFKTLSALLVSGWTEFNIQTRLMAAATLVVSLLMTALTFWSVNSIQLDARLQDTRFGKDLGLLLATNVTPLVAKHQYGELAQVSREFYGRTTSIRYMFYADQAGRIFYGIPFSEAPNDSALTLKRKIQLPDNFTPQSGEVMVRQHPTPDGQVTDIFIPLLDGDNFLGVLALGINPNPAVVTSSSLTRNVAVAVFIAIWVIFVLGAVFNAFIITKPIKELVVGVTNISAGDFTQRVNLPFGGELGELIVSFNLMAEKLESFEAQNIEELTAEKAKLETLVSTIADGAILVDTEMKIVLANATARNIFDWNQSVLGENVLEHFPEALRARLNRPLAQTVQGEFDGEEFRVALEGPSSRTIRILLTTVLDQSKVNPKGIAITIQDITREAELDEAQSQFISNVSHELRTPLFNIKSFIETLHEFGDSLSEEDRREFLDTANRETDRLTRLVNDVLDLSKLESGKRYRFEPVDLRQPIEQTIRTYQLNARDKGIELIQDISPELPSIVGNYDLLLQVLMNLVGNALKFTPSGGQVSIKAYSIVEQASSSLLNSSPVETPHIRVEIVDTGIGIPPEDQQAIFDRFFRVENRVHTLEGTGLGLSIVRNIIEKHQSCIHLTSEVGVGTRFWFDLAISEVRSEAGSISV
jgi:two-component system, OmpR family, sensor histidine kinase NblS